MSRITNYPFKTLLINEWFSHLKVMVLAVTDLAYISQPLYSEGKQHLSKHEELKILYAQVHENVKTARLYNMLSELP